MIFKINILVLTILINFNVFGYTRKIDGTTLSRFQQIEAQEIIGDIIFDGLTQFENDNELNPLFNYVVKYVSANLSKKVYDSTNQTMAARLPVNCLVPFGITIKTFQLYLQKTSVCTTCAPAVRYVITRIYSGAGRDYIARVLIKVCSVLKLQREDICRGLIESNADIIYYIIKNAKKLRAKKVCSIVLQDHGCYKDHRSKWTLHIPRGNSPRRFNEDYKPSKKVIPILHLTDIHIDPMYAEGALADCKEFMCCQKDSGNSSKPGSHAGKWGDYRNCDMPLYSFENTLDQITQKPHHPKFAYVYFTGDIISHRIWDTSITDNQKMFQTVFKLLHRKFGRIPVLPILGNHEPHPLNVFTPSSIIDKKLSTQWLFDEAVAEWSRWLPEETHNTIRYGGFYTLLLRPGLRIIALNSNVCYVYNWWLVYKDKDPYDQLEWLTAVLLKAESRNESVHILSHIPPGDETCLQAWSRQYHRIVERFANTITGQFNGHTHFVEWRVFYNASTSKPFNVAYNGGSFTTYNDLNPNYRIYDIHTETFEVMNYRDWTYKVDEANMYPNESPEWYQFKSFKETYPVRSLMPKDVGELVQKMAKDTSLMKEYYRLKHREAKPAMEKDCDENCILENWCSIVVTQVGITEHPQCERFIK